MNTCKLSYLLFFTNVSNITCLIKNSSTKNPYLNVWKVYYTKLIICSPFAIERNKTKSPYLNFN